MAGSSFVDYVKICCRSGAGGSGSAHFHRDKLTAKGGPDGGDEDVADISSFEVMHNIGPYFT